MQPPPVWQGAGAGPPRKRAAMLLRGAPDAEPERVAVVEADAGAVRGTHAAPHAKAQRNTNATAKRRADASAESRAHARAERSPNAGAVGEPKRVAEFEPVDQPFNFPNHHLPIEEIPAILLERKILPIFHINIHNII